MSIGSIKPALQAGAPAGIAAMAAIDAKWALAMALGMLGGWLARASDGLETGKPWAELRRDIMVSLTISGGSLLATLYFARLTAADELGVATIGFLVCWTGKDALRLLKRVVLGPIISAIKNIDNGGKP